MAHEPIAGASVLIVDDEQAIRSVLEELLDGEGYRARVASTGREAIAELERSLPDIMLLDLMMPDIDGYGVLDYLRRNLLQAFPVLVFSAQRPGGAVLDVLDSPSRDFIAKPFEVEELLVRMRRLLLSSPSFSPDRPRLRVYALGSLRVYRDDQLLFDESWRNKPAKTIFKLLFTHPGRRYSKDTLAEELWPETDPDAAANRLRVAVHELRKVLGEGGRKERAVGHIAQQEGSYFFDLSPDYWSDVKAFEEAVSRGVELSGAGLADEALHAYEVAQTLYQGDYLRDDPYLDWTIATRERIREMHLAMLADAARLHALSGQYDEAAGFCRKILRVEPWREQVYCRLMEYLALAGRRNEALRAYEECKRALFAEVEAEPSPETMELRNRIASGDTPPPLAASQ